jgi:hypothetical protein
MSAGFSVEAADTGRLIGIQILQRDRLFWPLAGAEVDGPEGVPSLGMVDF